jgi:outer membrane murein-binding lipoprotein Lpp
MFPASRVLLGASRQMAARTFHTSARRMADATPLPARKPMGAFRGGLFGFLLGTTLAGSTVYSYLVKEYKAANDLLSEDIYTLQAAVARLSTYVQALEEKKK